MKKITAILLTLVILSSCRKTEVPNAGINDNSGTGVSIYGMEKQNSGSNLEDSISNIQNRNLGVVADNSGFSERNNELNKLGDNVYKVDYKAKDLATIRSEDYTSAKSARDKVYFPTNSISLTL